MSAKKGSPLTHQTSGSCTAQKENGLANTQFALHNPPEVFNKNKYISKTKFAKLFFVSDSSRPQCQPEDAKSCEQLCFLDDAGAPMCECYSGYNRRADDQTCEVVVECGDDNGGCEHICINKPGTSMCDCRKGYQTLGTYCMDVNECLLNNGHGPCQDKCRYGRKENMILKGSFTIWTLFYFQESGRELHVLM